MSIIAFALLFGTAVILGMVIEMVVNPRGDKTMKIKLGDVVRDTISGFTGVAMGRFEYLHGCVRVQVNPQELRKGKPIDSQIFDEGQLEVIAPGMFVGAAVKTDVASSTGGPREDDRLARR